MADIRPFCAIRPSKDKAVLIAALPYDVYNREEAREVVKDNKDSFLNIDRPETQFEPGHDMYAPEVYAKADEMLREMIADGRFIRDDAPCYYLYSLTMDGRTQTGIVAASSVDDYDNGVIKKHENTRAEKEADRIRHVDTTSCQTGPIFLAYRRNTALSEITKKVAATEPVYDFTSEDGITHTVHVISDESDVAAIKTAFDGISQIYIADGHHRAASAVKVSKLRREANPGYTGNEEFNFFLSVLFPDDELKIFDYNRVVKDLNGLSSAEFIAKIGDVVEVGQATTEQVRPASKGEFSMYIDGKWYLCKVNPKDIPTDPVEALDVSLLQNLVLNPILGIADPKTDNRIDFVGGIRGLKELERRCSLDCKVAFAMYPTSISELFDVADAGLLMPPKSTWFEPKLRSGLFIHEIERDLP